MTYKEQLKDSRWINKRDRIIERDKYCQNCGSVKKLEAHHLYYIHANAPWQYPDEALMTLCHDCHKEETKYNKILKTKIDEMLKAGILSIEIIKKIDLHFDL